VGVASALLVKFYLEVIISMPCVRQTKLTAGDLMRAMRGVWLSCLILAAAGLAVRFTLCDRLPARQVLLAQRLARRLKRSVTTTTKPTVIAIPNLRYPETRRSPSSRRHRSMNRTPMTNKPRSTTAMVLK
jgi:hypothetical protein